MTAAACSRAIDIPELQSILTSYLSPADLLACVQVNSQWNEYFIPKLWHTIDDRLQSWEKILGAIHSTGHAIPPVAEGKDEDWIRRIFTKYGHHVRRLHLKWPLLVDAIGSTGSCTNLQDLKIDICSWGGDWWFWTRKSKGPMNTMEQGPLPQTFGHRVFGMPSEADRRRDAELVVAKVNELTAGFSHIIQPAFKDMFRPPIQSLTDNPSDLQEILQEGLIFTQHYWKLVLDNPDLQQLNLLHIGTRQWYVKHKGLMLKALSEMKGLKQVSVHELLNLSTIWNLGQVMPSVENVSVASYRSPVEEEVYPDDAPLLSPLCTVKALSFISNGSPDVSSRCGSSIQDIVAMLSLFPNLQTLVTMSIETTSRTTIPKLPDQGSALKILHVSSDANLAHLLPYVPNLRELYVDDTVAHEAFELLATHCKDLEVLECKQQPWYINDSVRTPEDEDSLHQLLESCRNLRVFDGIEHFINANDMIWKPWACQRIEKLRCRIVGVERLTPGEQAIYDRIVANYPSISNNDSTTVESMDLTEEERKVLKMAISSKEQQRQVYERLASLRHLKHLDLGYESRYPWTYKSGDTYISQVDGEEYLEYDGPIPDTLELSLESGLDQLGALKDLEMFGFEAIDHRIQEKELEWMAESWPKLKLMYGLDHDRLDMIELDRRKEELKVFMQTLRPDVVHDSLFEDSI
ncbi:hypothetical protein B0O80DRAFT_524273 [Mortierella sp. GBAus27b]|nr:hypothetical protein BGX31_000646 [Mortierella sp. GBA43]KAI8363772.1 hypothetical protein B0O80DRAFT_524273 [Mortierella sp. GBAus27b]